MHIHCHNYIKHFYFVLEGSGVARPGPTRACALPSAISFESYDSPMDQTGINSSANDHKSVTKINATVWKSSFSQERV